MNIIFIAPPAAGKGTQAKKISKYYNIPHISMGDLLRTIEDEEIKNKLSKGEFVDDKTVIDLLKKRILNKDCEKGYILDGFPRTLNQAALYDGLLRILNKEKGIVIVLDVDKEIAKKRILGRKICNNCGFVFNDLLEESKPKIKDVCDNCGNALISRPDDNEETFEHRFQTYIKQTEPLIEHYNKKGIIYRIDSNKNAENTFNQIKEILGEVYDKH